MAEQKLYGAPVTIVSGDLEIAGITAGSVLFYNGGIAQDNLNFFWNPTANAQRLIIGAGTNPGEIRFKEGSGSGVNYHAIKAPAVLAGNIALILPPTDGNAGDVLTNTDGAGTTVWAAPVGGGTVSGNGTDNHIARFDGTDDIQDSGWEISDADDLFYTDGIVSIHYDSAFGTLTILGASSVHNALAIGVLGDTNGRLEITDAGQSRWSDGSAAADSFLERSAAGWLKMGTTGLHIDGPHKIRRTGHGNSNYTILATDYLISTSAALSAARTWTLPAATSNAGQVFVIKDGAGGVTGINKLNITTAGGNIDGAGTVAIITAYGHLMVVSNGTDYEILDSAL